MEKERREISGENRGKKDRLTPFFVSEIILNKNIMTVTELHALAQEQEQKEEGKTDLVEFILSRSPKNLGELLNTTWAMKTAKEKIARSKKSRWTCSTKCPEQIASQSAMEFG